MKKSARTIHVPSTGGYPTRGHQTLSGLASVALLLVACGGASATPPASATPAPVTSATPPAAAAPVVPAATSVATPAPAAEPVKPETTPITQASAAPTATPSPTETAPNPESPSRSLTAPRVAFLIDYANSEAKTKALAKCDKDPKGTDDPAVKATCMDKARAQFQADVLVFKSDKKGHETLTIYKRNDSVLKELYTAPVSLKDEGANAVQLKFKGGGSGQRPLFKNTNSPTLKLPNDYTLEIDDPEYGNLRYDAKIGLVGQ